MATGYSLSKQVIPPGTASNEVTTVGELNALAGGFVTLDSLAEDMLGVWPAADAVNGPLLVDSAITNSAPSFTGLSLVPWNSGRFNTQSENWLAVPASNGPTLNQACQNTTTPRGNYGATGIGFPCHTVTTFVVDTAKIIVAYWVCNTSMVGVTTPHHEVALFAEHEGKMKGLREAPAVWPHGSGGGNQIFYKSFTLEEAREREFELWLSSNCWFIGVYIDTGADIQKAPNRPLLISAHGDSWGEGDGNVFSAFGGNGSEAGVGFLNCSLLYSNTALMYRMATRFATIISHQGGTGPFANNGGISFTSTSTGFSPFGSTSQVNFMWNTFGGGSGNDRNPCAGIFGGWNDGTTSGAPYLSLAQTRYTDIINNFLNKNPSMPILTEGIQCKSIGVGDARDLSNQGMLAAVNAFRAAGKINVLPYINNILDRNYVDIATSYFGPDTIHERIRGAQHTGINRHKKSANYKIPSTWVNQTLAWAG
jgi:hypothetical protein